MKFVYVSCNISKLEQLTEEIRNLGIKTFQIVEDTAGGCPQNEYGDCQRKRTYSRGVVGMRRLCLF